MQDPHNLKRFVDAQATTYDFALAELRGGEKRSHWMWFIFPQFDGLGSSFTAQKYAIKSLDEAAAYLVHDALGPRLIEATEAALGIEGRSASQVFGFPDDLKFCSSMTLFSLVPDAPDLFTRAIDRFYDGARDERTVELVRAAKP